MLMASPRATLLLMPSNKGRAAALSWIDIKILMVNASLFVTLLSLPYGFFLQPWRVYARTKAFVTEGWVEVPATITGRAFVRAPSVSHINRSRSASFLPRTVPEYSYRFTYGGHEYHGSSRLFASTFFHDPIPTKIGEPSVVWIRPNDPVQNMLWAPVWRRHLVYNAVTAAAAVPILVVLASWLRKRATDRHVWP